MKKIIKICLIIMICCLTTNVFAQEKVYNICKEGCEYDDLLEVFTDINFLRNGEDVIINFKDDASYSFDANIMYNDTEFDLDETFKKVCRKHGGEYVEKSWGIPRDCIINGNHMFYDEEGKSLNYDVYPDSAFISGEKISSVTINGASNRTQINMTQFDDYFALIPLAACSGIIN